MSKHRIKQVFVLIIGAGVFSILLISGWRYLIPELAPLQWDIQIVQDGKVLDQKNGEIRLERSPFVIQVFLPTPLPVRLNALANDSYFSSVKAGINFRECLYHDKVIQPFCPFMTLVEKPFNESQSLEVDATTNHYLYYANEKDHRWSRVWTRNTTYQFERDVVFLNDLPLKSYDYPRLYLVFLVDYWNKNIIDEGELKKVVLFFDN